eukprot:GHVS01050199.1.p1 GENE.GHVS01050199.1~~GHVS01050199.1.p1  ORF type:complete len:375 (-),score=24.73 GHVS01050199.1:219-1343(-)
MDNVGISSVVMMFLLPLLAVLVLNASAEKLRQEQPFLALPRKLGGSEEMTMEWHPISASVPNICRKDNGKGVNFPDARVPWQLETKLGMTIVACGVAQVPVAKEREATVFIMKENGDMHSENDSAIQFKLCEHLPWYLYDTEEWLDLERTRKGRCVRVTEQESSLFRNIFFISEDKLPLPKKTSDSGLLILPEKLSLPTLLGTDKLDELVQFRFDWVDPEKAPLQFDLTQSQTMKLRVVRKTETTIKLSQSSVQCDPDAKPIYVEYDVNMVLRPGDVKFESGGARISVYFSMADGRPLFLESAVNTHDIDLSEESLNDGTVTLTTKVGVTLTTKMDSPGFLRLLTAPHYTLRQDVPIKHSRKEYDWATKIIGRT